MICVSGTPGTGKTTYAMKLAKEKKYEYVDVIALIKNERLTLGYDKKLKSLIADVPKLVKRLEGLIKTSKAKGVVIDSHLSHYLSPKLVDQCIIMKTPIPKLRQRLKKRKYSLAKIQENVDAENFDVCYNEAVELGHTVKVVTS